MGKSPLILKDDPLLRQPSQPVTIFDSRLRETVRLMRETMVAHHGVGLAANQIGLNLAVFIARPEEKFYTFINPSIELIGESTLLEEGCLSVPKIWGMVKRAPKIKLRYYNLLGQKKTLVAVGLLAQIIQHEVDHLQGKLFIDTAVETWRLDDKPKSPAHNA